MDALMASDLVVSCAGEGVLVAVVLAPAGESMAAVGYQIQEVG